jgi:hypothetical protein
MSQNEKLRALLAEARDLFETMRQADAFAPHAYDRGDDDASIVDLARHIRARIDAALAEPTGPERSPLYPGEGTWSVFAEKVMAERDEARAEVERLNALLDGVVGACKYACNRESHCGVCAIAFKGISP